MLLFRASERLTLLDPVSNFYLVQIWEELMFRIFTPKLVLGIFVLSLSPSLAGSDLSVDQMINGLSPKVRTRGIGASAPTPNFSLQQINVINRVRNSTRGLSAQDRSDLGAVVASSDFPALDLEVNFAFNSDKLEPQSVLILSRLGTALSSEKLQGASFVVAGHTDAVGSKDYNQRLSESRAVTVKNFLATNFKISPQKLIVVGYGQEMLKNKQNPYADENRRVQILNLGPAAVSAAPGPQAAAPPPPVQAASPVSAPPLEPSDPLAALDGAWVAVNPPGPQINFFKAGLGQRMASLSMGQASIRLSDGSSGSQLRVSGEGFNCYYSVGFVSSDEMVWELKQGDSTCLSNALYRKYQQ